MSLSVREIASNCLGLESAIKLRRDLFGRLGDFSGELKLRRQLKEIRRHHCDFALPPKYILPHPRLAPLPAIHFDHYNSSVTDLAGPTPGEVDAKLISHGRVLGICLNFLLDDHGNLYGFSGELLVARLRVAFNLTLLNEDLEKVDEHHVTTLPAFMLRSWDRLEDLGLVSPSELPVNLGYFVMDNEGRVIVVKNDTDVVFLKKNAVNKIEPVQTWHMADQLRGEMADEIAEQTLAQVMPAHDRGYWIMALGNEDDDIPAYLGKLSNSGRLEDIYVFRGEIIENGMAVDQSGAYIVTDWALYKFSQKSDGRLECDWREEYDRASEVKPGTETLSRYGSGSTPTLLGKENDLVAITDNADRRVKLRVFDRESGREICEQPLFKEGESANENTVVGYDDTIIVQNWYDSPRYDETMLGLKPGLWRIDVREDRSGCGVEWTNDEFATTATVRLSTRTGLLYGTIQTGEDDEYAMAFVDFHSGRIVQKVPMPGNGREYRIAMSPAYFVPGGRLVQPVRRGVVVFRNI